MAILHISSSEFEKTLETQVPVLVDFWAPWCGPCKMLGPELEDAEAELAGKVVVAKVNIEEGDNKALASKMKVMSIPNMVIFKDGKEVDRAVGYLCPNTFNFVPRLCFIKSTK